MEKSNIKIVADSTCDLPENIINQYDIAVIPHYVRNVYGRFIDKEEITSDNVVDYFENEHGRLEAESPTIKEFEQYYKQYLREYDTVIHIVISKNNSKSYLYASEAAKKFDNVYVINSKSLSVGYGMIVMKAAELCKSGMSAETILSEIEEYCGLVNFNFVMDSFEMMGRAGLFSMWILEIVNFLKLHIDMRIKNDKISMGRIYFGKMPWVYNQFVKKTFFAKNIDTRNVFIVTVGCSNKLVENIQLQISKYCKFDNIFVTKASSAISCNCSKGTVGIAYASFNVK